MKTINIHICTNTQTHNYTFKYYLCDIKSDTVNEHNINTYIYIYTPMLLQKL